MYFVILPIDSVAMLIFNRVNFENLTTDRKKGFYKFVTQMNRLNSNTGSPVLKLQTSFPRD